jgi:chromosome segregation ATPase
LAEIRGFSGCCVIRLELAVACPFATLDVKIKSITKGLQSWSDKNVGHINFQLALAREILHRLEIANDKRNLSERETWFRNNLKKHSLALSSLKRTIARLRSRIAWLREGDANSSTSIHATAKEKISLPNLSPKIKSTQNMRTRLNWSIFTMKRSWEQVQTGSTP